ncbi:Asp/Glu/hydantoin racemase [Geopyxis carbonaria]|nr:Asp/Glu/hydantoin racemase [Geopyxis carbonaria]
MPSLLIINPNSTVSMTTALSPTITPLLPPGTSATYFTAPPGAPPSINDSATEALSTTVCLPLLIPLLQQHDGFLLCCFSAHSLVPALRARTRKPVVGILEAAVFQALSLLPDVAGTFGIVSTGKQWERMLTEAVEELLGGGKRLGGVETTGLDADQLEGAEDLEERMREATKRVVGKGVKVVVLGCAGMVGLEKVVGEAAGEGVRVVDGVKAGVGMLCGMLGRGYEEM